MNDLENKIKAAIQSQKAFSIFKKPDENEIRILTDDKSGKNRFLMHSFDSKTEVSVSDSNPLIVKPSEFQISSDICPGLQPSGPVRPLNQDQYRQLVLRTVEEINKTDIRKIVISRVKIIENPNYRLFELFLRLTEMYPSALVYFWNDPKGETWMGATPELLLSKNGNRLKTVSLAGTKKPEAEWTAKEIDEQQIVTDYILDAMKDLPNLESKGPETVSAGKFQHLKSYISATAPDDLNLPELLEKLHPTPAVCGLPKKEAFDFIIQNEGYKRGFYTGYIGFENQDSSEYFVNLRCAQIFRESLSIYVGGGITADSQPDREWDETEMKSGTVLNALIS